jgi:hypothetical protein
MMTAHPHPHPQHGTRTRTRTHAMEHQVPSGATIKATGSTEGPSTTHQHHHHQQQQQQQQQQHAATPLACRVCGQGLDHPDDHPLPAALPLGQATSPPPFSIQCDQCRGWCHSTCVGMQGAAEAEAYERWCCPPCQGEDQGGGHPPSRLKARCAQCHQGLGRVTSSPPSAYCGPPCAREWAEARWRDLAREAPAPLRGRVTPSSRGEEVEEVWYHLLKATASDAAALHDIAQERKVLGRELARLERWEQRIHAHLASISSTTLCGFDVALLQDADPLLDVIAPSHVLQLALSPPSPSPSSPSAGEAMASRPCASARKCARHDGWEKMVSRLVQRGLDDVYEALQTLQERQATLYATQARRKETLLHGFQPPLHP